MRATLVLSGLVLVCLLYSGADVDAQKKDKKGKMDVPTATPEDYKALASVKELTGKLMVANTGSAGAGSITFRLEIQHLEPNPAYKGPKGPTGSAAYELNRRYDQVMRDYAEVARARTPLEQQRRLMNLQRDMARLQQDMARMMAKSSTPPKAGKNDPSNPFRVATTSKDYEFDLSDKLVVRWNQPPFQYDDKGEVKTYTKEELAEMRGKDPKIPGYKAKIEELLAGQTVKIFLNPPPKKTKPKDDKAKDDKVAKADDAKADEVKKDDGKKDDVKKGDAKKTGKNLLDDLDIPAGDRPTVRMVLILEDAVGLSFGGPEKKKKK
ncbi:MAG: hypothetical protein U0793_17890 [Gemmataceae bacterium]